MPLATGNSSFGRVVSPLQPPETHVALGIDVVQVSSTSPARLHPFFLSRMVRAAEETHEMRFHAIARQPDPVASVASPRIRQPGRLRRRVSTPIQQAAVAMIPSRPQGPTRPQLVDFDFPDVDALTISTPTKLGSAMEPRKLFSDSPFPSPILVLDGTQDSRSYVAESVAVAIQCSTESRECASQTSPRLGCEGIIQTSPRLSDPVTLFDLRNEMHALLARLCWL